MPVFRPYDPVPAFMFAVELNDQTAGFFTECEGLSLEREVVEYKEGGTNDYIYQFPGRIKQSRVRLRRGVGYPILWRWFNVGVRTGKVQRVNMSILVLSRMREASVENWPVVQRWDLLSAWPVKYEGPNLKADSVEPALELLEIAYNGLLFTTEIDQIVQ